MRRLTAIMTVVLLACLGLAGTGNAQAPQVLQMQGVIQAVDCQAQQLILNTGGTASAFQSTGVTAVFVNGTLTQLCTLQSFIGAPATVLVAPADNQFVLDRVDVTAQVAPQPALVSVGTPAPSVAGIALGAFVLGALATLFLHNGGSDNHPVAPVRPQWSDRACRDANWGQCRR